MHIRTAAQICLEKGSTQKPFSRLCKCPSMLNHTDAVLLSHRWEDLPGAVLSHLLQLAPYKRADVKLVCQSWRVSINESIKAVSLPENDLDLLKQLTAVQMLTVTAACAGVLKCTAAIVVAHRAAAHTTRKRQWALSGDCLLQM